MLKIPLVLRGSTALILFVALTAAHDSSEDHTMPRAVFKKQYTHEDYLQTPENTRYELINGQLTVSPVPTSKHQEVSASLLFELSSITRKNKLGEIIHTPCDVHLDEHNTVQPDILYISKERLGIIGEKNITAIPDLIVEIVSPGSVHRDVVEKMTLYENFGLKEYWIVYPLEEIVDVYVYKDRNFTLHSTHGKQDVIGSVLVREFKIALSGVFV